MKRIILLSLTALSCLAMAAWATPRALADDDDDGDHAEIKITAPLEAVDCVSGSITVLGLVIDINGARLRGDECEDDDEDDDDQGEDEQGDDLMNGDDDDDDGDCRLVCEDLLVGQSIEVRMASDIAPLVATEVRAEGDDDDDD